jgi:DNA segregation ATPase FtsK/SpoIIIE, S-DNA-T family
MALDAFFEPAARLVVQNQIGSTSFIQRKLNLSYSRALHVISLLEIAGVVSPIIGVTPREVLPKSESDLEVVIRKFKENRLGLR